MIMKNLPTTANLLLSCHLSQRLAVDCADGDVEFTTMGDAVCLAIFDPNDGVGCGEHLHVMRRRDDRDAEFRLQVAEQGDDLLACVQVQIARRFVRQNDGRLVHEGAGDGDALLLAAGNL